MVIAIKVNTPDCKIANTPDCKIAFTTTKVTYKYLCPTETCKLNIITFFTLVMVLAWIGHLQRECNFPRMHFRLYQVFTNYDVYEFPVVTQKHGELILLEHGPLLELGYTDTSACPDKDWLWKGIVTIWKNLKFDCETVTNLLKRFTYIFIVVASWKILWCTHHKVI